MTETITSTHNARIKELRALHRRRERERTGLFMAEGEDMLVEALRHGSPPVTVFFDAEVLSPGEPPMDGLPSPVEVIGASARVLASAGSLASGARVVGVWPQRWVNAGDLATSTGKAPSAGGRAAIYLHDVADPGNVGAAVRAAFGFGAAGVVLSAQTADPFGPKAVRAAMGAVFAVPLARAGFDDTRAALGTGWRTIGLAPRAGRPLGSLSRDRASLFVLGAERAGLPIALLERCDEIAHVPLVPDGAESLNVAMTATLCLYEAAVHRLSPTDG